MFRRPAALLVAAGCLLAVTPPARASAPAPRERPTAAALAAFFDETLHARLAEEHVPGAVVSVVTGGRTVFSRGYGEADVERKVPMDPAASLVRIASVSKLFTWTAVMQLADAGKVDLRADVAGYLPFALPDEALGPVTLLDLMNHTAGFEDRGIGNGARSKADVPPLAEYLEDAVPARTRPPGQVSSYSNYGAALAGLVVERVSGEPYEEYVRRHVLDPLGMSRSTATEPVPEALAEGLARSYTWTGSAYEAQPFVFDKLVPDGSVSATADDMARFMAAHLDDDGGELLSPRAATAMHTRSFAADPRLDGYAHGFKERTLAGHRALMHDGSWEEFQTALVLVPDTGIGLFVSANGDGGIEVIEDLVPAFAERFLPAAPGATGPAAPDAADAAAGFYVPARTARSTVEKLLLLTGQTRVRAGPGDTVTFRGDEYTAAGARLWRNEDGERLAFREIGGRTYLVTDGTTLERVAPADAVLPNLVLLAAFLLVSVTALVGFPAAALVRRLRHRPRRGGRAWRAARLLALGAAAAGLVYTVLLGLILVSDTGEFIYGYPAGTTALLFTSPVIALLAVAALAATVTGWRAAGAGVLVRGHQVLLLVTLLAFAAFLVNWRLLPPSLG